MKRFIMLGMVLILFVGALSLMANFAADPIDEGGGGGSSTAIYSRYDINCQDPKNPWREKTHCLSKGQEQCTAKYCN